MRKLAFIVLALCLLAGCTSKEVVPGSHEVTIRICNDTKAVLDGVEVKWETGDQVGVTGCGYNNTPVSVNADGTFSISISEAGTLNAYYPYSASGSASVPSAQTNGDFDAMPQVADPLVLTGSETTAEMWFKNQGSVARFVVSSTSEVVSRVIFQTSTSKTYDLTCPSGPANIDMVVEPGTYTGSLEVYTNIAKYSYSVSSKTFVRSNIKPLKVDLKKGTRYVTDVITAAGAGASGAEYLFDTNGVATSKSGGYIKKLVIVGTGSISVYLCDDNYSSTLHDEYGEEALATGGSFLEGGGVEKTVTISTSYTNFRISGTITSVKAEWKTK